MRPSLQRFFEDYTAAFNRSLAGEPDVAALRAAYTDEFIAAGPHGVHCGRNDAAFTATLNEAYAFYRSIGTRRMTLRGVEETPIDERHTMARALYRADYRKPSGEALSIDFDVTYLLQFLDGSPRIFAFVAGDEMASYRRHGLV